MTGYERFKSVVARECPDTLPYFCEFIRATEKRLRAYMGVDDAFDLQTHFGMRDDVRVRMRDPVGGAPKYDYSKYYEGYEIPANAKMNYFGMLEIPGSVHHFTRYVSPLRNMTELKDIEDYPIYQNEGKTGGNIPAEVEKAHSEGRATRMWCGDMYESAWQMRGYEQFLEDMLLNPENCESILDRVMNRDIVEAVAAAKGGVDIITTGDDVANQRAMMFAVPMWRKFIKSRWAKVYAAARAIKPDIQIWYHSDGDIRPIIPELIEIGVTILNPIQPECMDPVEIKRLYGDKLILDGTIGTQTVMPFGTPEDVREMVRKMKREVGYDGGLYLAPTHVLEPEVPPENIIAFLEESAVPM